MFIDVFNGDADGILSLVQLRKAFPVDNNDQKLITGVKRDISLCKKIENQEAKGSHITVLDISYDKNSDDIQRLLNLAKKINYFDHHKADSLLANSKLNVNIDLSADVCTALLVSDSLEQKHHLWAIAAAYGDNLHQRAEQEADKLNLTVEQKAQLKELGVLVNYNGYGSSIDDLYYHPKDLFCELMRYNTPFDVITDKSSCFYTLKKGFEQDNKNLSDAKIDDIGSVYIVNLPNKAWARRISGTLGNDLANKFRDKAIVVLTEKDNGNYLVSLRASKNDSNGAANICSKFVTGGGREAAAGINDLPRDEIKNFINNVQSFYS